MATAGYYLRQRAMRADDGTLTCGDQWSLVRIDSRYQDEVVAAGLTEAEAMALYWQKLEELVASRSSGGDTAPDASDAGAPIERQARRPRQLAFKL